MHFSTNFLALSALIGALGASAAPAVSGATGDIEIPMKRGPRGNLLDADGYVSFDKIAQEVAHLRSKYVRNMKNFEANTGTKHVMDATHLIPNERRGTGSVSLTDTENQQLWVGNIAFGSPAQQIPIDFDTGSSDTLVNPGAYTPSKSSSSKDTHTTFQDSYGDGTTASGEVYSDKLTIGGLSANTAYIGLSQQQFIKGEGSSQGISGMAFPELASFQQKEPYFFSLVKAKAVDAQAFQFKLRKQGSTLTLGSASQGATYTPVTQAAYWSVSGSINHGGSGKQRRQFGSGSGSFGSGSGSFGGGSGSTGAGSGGAGGSGNQVNGIIDSGTTLIVAPTSDAKALFSSMGLQTQNQQGQLMATYDCSKQPDVSFTFGSKTISLGDSTSFGSAQNGQCVFAVVGADVGSAGWIVGDPLFQQTTVTFDVGGKRVGFD